MPFTRYIVKAKQDKRKQTEYRKRWEDIPWEKYEDSLRILAALAVYTLVLTPFFFKYHHLRKQERLYDEDCCRHFQRLVQMLHLAGYLTECDGMEDDFAKRLAEQFPDIKADDIERMARIVEKAAYGRPDSLSKMEEVFVKALCRDFSKQIYGRSKWCRFRSCLRRYKR